MRQFLLLALACLVVGCVDSKPEKAVVRNVKCDTVRMADNSAKQSYFSGRVKAATESNIAFRVAGQIEQMNVKQGQYVRKGTVMAKMDDRDYRTQLAATQAEYRRIKSEADRVIELYGKQSVAAVDYDKAVYGLQQITAKLEAHKNALSDTRLIAPFDGYVEKKYFDRGETVGAGMAVISMISTEKPQIEINIPTADFVKRGDFESASATIDAFDDKVFRLQLVGINQKANLNQLYTTLFEIVGTDKSESWPAPGMTAMVSVQYKGQTNPLMQIPVEALVEDSVWVVASNTVSKKAVKVIEIKVDGRVLIEGLDSAEVIVSGGTNSLKEGQTVKVLPKRDQTNEGDLL